MGIQAYFIKKDSTIVHKLLEAEIEALIVDRHKTIQDDGHSHLSLKFVFTDAQQQYEGFKFTFSVSFYEKLGGDKAFPDHWGTKEIPPADPDNREYYLLPNKMPRTITYLTAFK